MPEHKHLLEWPGWDPQVDAETTCHECNAPFRLIWVPTEQAVSIAAEQKQQYWTHESTANADR